MANKIRMVNIDPNNKNHGKVKHFTELTANSEVLKREGWVREEPVKEKKELPKAEKPAEIENSADVSDKINEVLNRTEARNAEPTAEKPVEAKPKGKPGRKAAKK